MTPENDIKTIDWGRATIGGLILLVGAVMLVDVQLDFMGYRIGDLWPLIVIGVGIARLSGAETVRGQRRGLLMVLIGVWLLVASLGLWGLHFGNSWPLAVIAVGVATLLRPDRDSRHSGYWLVGAGMILLLLELQLLNLTWSTAWPLFIILAGGSMIWRSVRGDRRDSRGDSDQDSIQGETHDLR